MAVHRYLLVFVLALPCACASQPETTRPLPLAISADHYAGTIHTGPLPGAPKEAADVAPSAEPVEPWWYGLRVAYVDRSPASDAEPVAARVRQVFVERGGRPLQSRSQLAAGVVAVSALSPRAENESLRRTDPLWPGTTTSWVAASKPVTADSPRTPWSRLAIELSRPEDPLAPPELALVLEGEVAHPGEDDDLPADSATPPARERPAAILQREHLVLDAAPRDGETLKLFVPAPRRGSPFGGFELELGRVGSPDGDDLASRLESALSALALSSARAQEGAKDLAADEGFHFERESALAALDDPRRRRPALVFLAQVVSAELAGDLAISAGEDELASYAAALRASVEARDPAGAAETELGWPFERASWQWLLARASDEQHPLAPELSALLLVHAGASGRFPDLIEEALGESDGSAALLERFKAQNLVFLEDADPAARVRAFDWLQSRGGAPAGFDPLATLAERRAALDAAAAEPPAAGPEATPGATPTGTAPPGAVSRETQR